MKKVNQMASILILAMLAGRAHALNVSSDTETAAMQLGARKVIEVEFKEGQSALDAAEVKELREGIVEAKNLGRIEEVKIIAWADQEYPAAQQAISKSEVKLGEARADSLKKYVKNNLGVDDVETYNMAKRPNAAQDLFETNQAKVKDKLESSGAAPTTKSQTGFLGFAGKASKSIVLVYVK